MADLHDLIEGAQDALSKLTPTPVILEDESTAYDLKTRLEWGEPALTIVDVRDRAAFNHGRITGAMSMPMEQFEEMAKSTLEPKHDIYIYGESDAQALEAAQILRNAGFAAVTQITGGLEAWHEVAGPTEGIDEDAKTPDANAYNLVSRLKTEKAAQETGKAQHTSEN
jgi:rhodanese-related sulfurtransferase